MEVNVQKRMQYRSLLLPRFYIYRTKSARDEIEPNKAEMVSLTRPLHVQDQAVVSTPMHLVHRALRHCPLFKTDKRKALPNAGVTVAADIDAHDTPKRAEQLAQVVLLCVLGDVGHAKSWEVIA
jgi:hypothetical protein